MQCTGRLPVVHVVAAVVLEAWLLVPNSCSSTAYTTPHAWNLETQAQIWGGVESPKRMYMQALAIMTLEACGQALALLLLLRSSSKRMRGALSSLGA